jgi:hypothetical protein
LKDDTIALPSARINKLLSHKCIIISEYTNEVDNELYKDLIYFCDISQIEDTYKKIISKSNIELQEEANIKYNLFYNKFYTNIKDLITEK